MEEKRINLQYIVLQGLYMTLYCVSCGFISFYLQGNGFANSGIGIITAVFCLFAVIFQPIVGNICDRIDRLTWKKLIIILGLPYIVICIAMLIIKEKWIIAILFGMMYIITNIYLPLINTALFSYKREGIEINFGVARGMGSAMYALMALFIGNIAVRVGTRIIPMAGIIIIALFLGVVFSMPVADKIKSDRNETKRTNIVGFIKKYPYFSIMLLAVLFIYFSHNIIGTYLLQIVQSLGGNSGNLGITMFIQALAEIPVLFTFSYIMKKVKIGNLMILAGIGYVVRGILYFISGSIMMIYIIQLSQIFSFAIVTAASVYFTGMVVDVEDQTTGLAFMSGMTAAGTVLGSLLGGEILDHIGMRSMLAVNILITIIGLGIAVCSIKLLRSKKKNKYV